MFEHYSLDVLPRHRFLGRLVVSLLIGVSIIAISLAGGMLGYHHFEGMNWIDSYINAAMILSGMGPLSQPQSIEGKLFAGCYALYSGFVVVLVSGIVFAPVVHRFLHRFHLEKESQETN